MSDYLNFIDVGVDSCYEFIEASCKKECEKNRSCGSERDDEPCKSGCENKGSVEGKKCKAENNGGSDEPSSRDVAVKKDCEKQGDLVPKFKIVAYTGVPMNVGCFYEPVVIELSGIKALNKNVPIRMNHDRSYGVGHATKVFVEDGALKALVNISRETEYAKDVYESAVKGFPWQISVGGRPLVEKKYEEGERFVANGKTYKGPMTHVEQFELDEMSFCDLGADSRTSARVSASRDLSNDKEKEMTEEKPDVAAEETIEETVVNEKTGGDVENVVDEKVEATFNDVVEVPVISKTVNASFTETKRFDQEKNQNRIAAINSLSCEGFEELRAQAIDEGWSLKDFNTALKAARHSENIVNPKELPKMQAVRSEISSDVIEAALGVMAIGENGAQKYYGEEVLNKAYDVRRKIQGFRDLFTVATGKTIYSGDMEDMGYVQAAFTTSSLNKIFKDVLNKTMLAAYNQESVDTWRKFCNVSSSKDFKPNYNYRVGGEFDYERIGQDGEIKNTKFSEQEFTNKAETWAKSFSMTREMIINDDLNVLFKIVNELGVGASRTINKVVFETLLSNRTMADGNAFFSAAHSNLVQGTSQFDASLGIASLAAAEEKLMNQLTPDGEPIVQEGKILLVPTALRIKAFNLMNAIEVNETTTANVPKPNINPFAGRFEVVATPWLNTPSISGGSAANWYLFGDSSRIPVIDVVFLNGKQAPTIEQKEASFDRFGVQYRGFIDFGVNFQDTRGAVYVNV